MEIQSIEVTHVTWISSGTLRLISKITNQIIKSSIVHAPLRGHPRSGARTICDFESVSSGIVCLSCYYLGLPQQPCFPHCVGEAKNFLHFLFSGLQRPILASKVSYSQVCNNRRDNPPTYDFFGTTLQVTLFSEKVLIVGHLKQRYSKKRAMTDFKLDFFRDLNSLI